MKTLYLSIISSIILVSLFELVGFQDVSAGIPLVVNYQLSQLDTSGNHVYVTYQNNVGNGAGSSIFFRKSSDDGSSFDKIMPLSNTTHAANPLVASSGNHVYITWMENWGGQGHSYVMFEQSSDGGNTFSTPSKLSDVIDGDANVQQIIASENNVYVLLDYSLQGNMVFRSSIITSHDNGNTFGNPIILLNDTQSRGSVNISASEDGKTIYAFGQSSSNCPIDVMKCDFQLFVRKSTDGGVTFEDPIVVKKSNQEIPYVHMTSSKNNVYLIWGENSTIINFIKSSDGGMTFSSPVNLSKDNTLGESIEPNISASGNDVYVIWENNSYSHPSGLFLTKSLDDGITFSKPVNLTGDIVHIFSQMKTSGNVVYITWMNRTTDKWDVFFTKGVNNGTTFDKIKNLTENIKYSFNEPQISVVGNNVYIAFGTRYPGNDILFVSSKDYGETFGDIINLNHYGKATKPMDLIHIESPIKQYRSGWFAKDVTCNPYLELVFKAENGYPACVKPESIPKLVAHGWAMATSDTTVTHMELQSYGSYDARTLKGHLLIGSLYSIAGPISRGNVTVIVNDTVMGTTLTDPGGCFQFNQWDDSKISDKINNYVTSNNPLAADLEFKAAYSGDQDHDPVSAISHSYLYAYLLPLPPLSYDTTFNPTNVTVHQGYPAQFEMSVKPMTKNSEVQHMKIHFSRLPCGVTYKISHGEDNDTSLLDKPAVFKVELGAGNFTPAGKYFIQITLDTSEQSGRDPDLGGFILQVLGNN